MHSRETLQKICDFFSVGGIVDCVYLGRWNHHNYFIDTKNGSFVLKVLHLEVDIVQRIKTEVQYINHLQDNSINVQPYISGENDDHLYVDDGICALIRPKVDGDILSKSGTIIEHLFEVGSQLGRLHSCPVSPMLPPRRCALSAGAVEETRQNIKERYPIEAFPLVDHPVLKTDWSLYPVSIIHGDCWCTNILVSSNDQITLIDWEEVSINPAILDIGRTLFSLIEANMIDAESYQAFISGYESRRILTSKEKGVIVQAMQYTGIVTLLWRQTRFFNTATPYDIEQSAWYTQNLEEWQPPRLDACL